MAISFKQSLVLVIFAATLYFGGAALLDEYRLYRAQQVINQIGMVDGLTLSEQAALAKQAGNSRYYSNAEMKAFLDAQGVKY